MSVTIAQKLKPDVIPNSLLMSECVCYLCIMQLALQAADLFSETEGFSVSRGQIAGEGINLTLKETK